jgi:hypothetical protein
MRGLSGVAAGALVLLTVTLIQRRLRGKAAA